MDDAWRFRPILDHQNCPVCFIPHYPFCPPPPTFFGDDHRRFPSDLRPPPFHCPFPLQPPPPPPPPPQPPRPPSQPPPFLLEEIRERESFPKRLRVEDLAIGALSPFQPFNRSLSFDDERWLNLIRDHGKQDISSVQEERRQSVRDYLMDRHHVEGLGSQFCSGGIDHDFPESAFAHPNCPKSTFGHRNGHFQASKAYEGYQNEQIPILEMEERFWLHERRVFDRVEVEADRRDIFNPQMVGHSHASQMPWFHGSVEALGGSENFIPSAQAESSNGSWRLASYSAIDDNSLRVESFHKQQQAQPMLSSSHLLPKLHPHPHTDSFDMLPSHQDHATHKHLESNSEFYERKGEMMRASFELRPPITDEIHKPFDVQAYQAVLQLGHHTNKQAGCTPLADEVNHVIGTSLEGQGHTSQAYSPIPPQPLFPIQTETSLSAPQIISSVSATVSIVIPVVADTSAKRQLSAYGSQVLPQGVLYSEPPVQASDGFANEGSPFIRQPSLNLDERGLSFLVKHSGKERPTYVDASHLFKQPYRASRPDHIVIILRGLPGSGKSYLAKALRDIEVENGGCAPRIHAMDDYFMIEVDKKVEDNEGFKSSGSVRSKKQVTKKVIEYCYEPEMEEAYRSSMLKAFKKTLDDGIFTFVVVDDRNLRVADFALFWAIAKRSGYEVYLLEATYKDPAGCSARNIHGFKLDEIQKMAKQWEEAPPLYLHLDIQSLFGGDDLNEQYIQEVDMDGDDTTRDGEAYHLQETNDCKSIEPKLLDQFSDHGSTKLGKRWNTEEKEKEEEEEEEEEEFSPLNNELQKSKWSKNLDVDVNGSKSAKGNTSALSGLIQAYGKGVKCVHWGDRDEMSGFLIGAMKKHVSSLIIGPGAGYNLNSNPLLEDDPVGDATGKISNATKRRFNEQLCAERESFRAVFDRRRRRIIGLWDADDE